MCRIVAGILTLFLCSPASAVIEDESWPLIQNAFFKARNISDVSFIQISAPKGAENPSQVPVTISINKQPLDPIVNLYLFVDANPIPMVAEFNFPYHFERLNLSTRIRVENDSNFRVIGESKSGKLFMAKSVIHAGGGCAGNIVDDETEVRASAGKVKFQFNFPFRFTEVASATFQVKHPMYTGLQYDIKTKIKRTAFFLKKADFLINSDAILKVNFGVGTAENPYLKFEFDLPAIFKDSKEGTVKILLEDNEGKLTTESIAF